MIPAPVLVAVDWGSSSVRAELLDAAGCSLEARRSEGGVLSTRDARHLDVLQSLAADWLQQWPGIPVLLSGMVGSDVGWYRVPYIDSPASIQALATHRYPVPNHVLANACIVPGVRSVAPSGLADVMRGEEVQYFGAWDDITEEPRVAILPGTHSKWVRGCGHEISTFATVPTGELFATLRASASLATLLEEGDIDDEQFAAGVCLSQMHGGLMHHVFSIRAAIVLRQLPARLASSRLSGLLIGDEIAAMDALFPATDSTVVIGEDALAKRYLTALAIYGRSARAVSGRTAASRGALRVARAVGLVEPETCHEPS